MARFPFLRREPRSISRRRLLIGGAGLISFSPLLLSGCGGGGSDDTAAGGFTGQFSGQVNLSQGQIGRYIITALRSGSASGLMEILGGSDGTTKRADLTGTVDQSTGRLDVSGSFAELERQIPVACRGLLQRLGETLPRNIEVSVDEVTYRGSISAGDRYPNPPGSGMGEAGMFSGQYSGQAIVSQGQLARYLITALRSGEASAVMEIISASSGVRQASLSGTVDQNTGQLDVAGSFEVAQRRIPVALRGLLQRAGEAAVRTLEVSVDNIPYPGSVDLGDSFPPPPGSEDDGDGTGQGGAFARSNGTFSYSLNGTQVASTFTEAVLIGDPSSGSGGGVYIYLFTGDPNVSSPETALVLGVPNSVGTYSIEPGNGLGQANFIRYGSTPEQNEQYGSFVGGSGTVEITSISAPNAVNEVTVQGRFDGLHLPKADSSGNFVDITGGTFTAAPQRP